MTSTQASNLRQLLAAYKLADDSERALAHPTLQSLESRAQELLNVLMPYDDEEALEDSGEEDVSQDPTAETTSSRS